MNRNYVIVAFGVIVLVAFIAYYSSFFSKEKFCPVCPTIQEVPCLPTVSKEEPSKDSLENVHEANPCLPTVFKEEPSNNSLVIDKYVERTWIDAWADNYSKGPGFDRWQAYYYPYERHFGPWRGKKVVMLEIGVQSGGSTIMWPMFFGPGLIYHGVDINPNCKQFERDNITIHLADQSNKDELEKLMKEIPAPDIIIDDGGHSMNQQITSFKVLFPYLKTPGVYLCEDLHTSYWSEYGGSSNFKDVSRSTMIEYSKSFVDILNLQHIRGGEIDENWKVLHSQIGGIAFYNSMVMIEKSRVHPWDRVHQGDLWIPY